MSLIGILRERYGLSAPQLAIYLGVSPSLLKMSGKGHRILPFQASMKLYKLELVELIPADENVMINKLKDGNKQLRNIAEEQSFQALKARKQLAKIIRNYQQAINCMALMDHLKQNLLPENETEIDELWINVQQGEARQRATLNGLPVQQYWQWKIDCYAFAAARALELQM